MSIRVDMAAGSSTNNAPAVPPPVPSTPAMAMSIAQQQQQQQLQQQLKHHQLLQQQRAAAAMATMRPVMGRPGMGTAAMVPPGMMQQAQAQQQVAMKVVAAEATPAPKRRKRKASEKDIPDKVAALLPESALYTQLVELEGRVDAALARKRLEIQETVQNPPRYQRTLRLYVLNTFANQPGGHDPAMGYNPGEPPSWTLRIMGRIVGDDGETESAAAKSLPFPKLSAFFKRITVVLDPALYPDGSGTIVWDASRSVNPVEGFEIKRKGDKEFSATIRLEMKYTPDRFKLSPPLAELLGVEVETRARIIAAFWHYIKGKKLQNPADPTVVMCDAPLQRILGEQQIKFTSISQKLQPHLAAPQPILLEHVVKLSGKNPAATACYDIVVDVATPLQKEMSLFLANIERHRDLEAYDEMICSSIRKINEHRKRRAFFLGFSQSPVEFINGLIASQTRDLKIVSGQASRSAERERRSDFYCQPWVEDAAMRYLNRRTTRVQDTNNANNN